MTLYHASHHNNLKKLDPRSLFADDGNLLFATPHKPLAAMFLAPKGFDVEITKFSDEFILLVNGSSDDFAEKDRGGTIYELLDDGFSTHDGLLMPGTEYVTNQSVTPVSSEEYLSAMDAMKHNGVQVYFTDAATMQKMRSADDHGQSIIKTLNPFV